MKFNLRKNIKKIKSLKVLRFTVSHETLVTASVVSIILLLAFMIRILPIRWGMYLSEFDPYSHYRIAEYVTENGFLSYTNWIDYQRWYPWGVNVAQGHLPGLGFTAAIVYTILCVLHIPISLYNLCVIFPVIMGTLTCLVIYFLGKDIGGSKVGVFSAFFLALSTSFISRTQLGFFDDESVGIFGILLFTLCFLRSIKEKSLKNTITYSVIAGLTLGWTTSCWGAAHYPIAITALFVFVMILFKRYSKQLLLSYSITFGIGLFLATLVPSLGLKYLTTTSVMLATAVFGLLVICELVHSVSSKRNKAIISVCSISLVFLGLLLLITFGYVSLPGKFIGAINPFERLVKPLVLSVAEHKVTAWTIPFREYGFGVFLFIIGIFFNMKKQTNNNIFLLIYGLTGAYFAMTMIRLTILLAPAFCMFMAYGLVNLCKPFVMIIKQAPKLPFKRKNIPSFVGKEFSGAFLIMMFCLLTYNYFIPVERNIFESAYIPTTIMASGIPMKSNVQIMEWYDTLMWMRNGLPDNAVVCSWWDYGYWITIMGNKTTLVDNATFNMTQIQQVALIYLSNETESVKILQKYDVTHVVLFQTFYSDTGGDIGYGEESKWRWMVRISGRNETDYGSYNEETGRWQWTGDIAVNSVIYKILMTGKKHMGHAQDVYVPEFIYLNSVYFSSGNNYGGVTPLVSVWEVLYDEK